MKTKEESSSPKQEEQYESATRLARWLTIGVILVTLPLDNSYTWAIGGIAVLYNIIRQTRLFTATLLLESRGLILALDLVLVTAMVYITGGAPSPYYPVYFIVVVSAIYWYAVRGLIVVVMAIGLATLGMVIRPIDSVSTFGTLRYSIAEVLLALVIGVLVDRLTHTEREERARALEANHAMELERERLLALINSLTNPVIAIDAKGSITLYNGAALELLNTNVNLTGKKLADLLSLIDEANHPADMFPKDAKNQIAFKRSDLTFVRQDGNRIKLEITLSAIHPQHRSQVAGGYILVLRDITKEKTLEEQKDEFISVTSHELKTPLAIAEANLSTALLPNFAKMDPKAVTLIDQAHRNIMFLGDLVKDLSTLAKAENGVLAVDLKMVDCKSLIDQLVRDYQPQAQAKGLALEVNVTPKLPPVLTSDYRVREVLQNFVTNALKYSQKGAITISVEPATEGDQGVVFSVKDTGIGISASDQTHIFERFYRSEDFRTRQTGGTGLGLYITKKLAERLNGKIWFKSKLNQGSTFYLQVPPFSQLQTDHRQVVNVQMDNFVDTI
jgi:PAS domain S-box-containing protein